MQKIQRLGSVTSEDLRDLFGNIRAIYEFNRLAEI